MIVAVTPNTALDYTLVVPRLELNATIRASSQAWGMGGKANDVAWILGRLGVTVHALGFAAGPTGARLEEMLRRRGVTTDFVAAGGETRLNVVLVHGDGHGQSTFSASTLAVSPDQQARFWDRYRARLPQATCLVLGGSLPAGLSPAFFHQAIAEARAAGIPVVFDASGPGLQAGLRARPSLVKPNRDELAALLGPLPESPAAIHSAAASLHSTYGVDVVVTLGGDGALALLGDRAYHIPPLSLPVASAAGAGDGVLAGLALALSRGEPLENGLRAGFALAAAIVQTLATADFRPADYEAALPQIELIPLPPL
jgi:1-phosphofructokinase family hexose kinase